MRIVVNADDFGMSDDTVRGTIACFQNGGLSSASIMPTMPATDGAIQFARAHRQFSFGVHLTFIADSTEHCVCDPSLIPDLVTDGGVFPPSDTVRKRALLGKLPVDQLVREIEAQLGFIRDHGVEISHVDSHGHLHKFASFRAALKQALPRFGIDRVRNVQDVYFKKPLKSPTFWLGPWWRRKLMRAFISTDHFYMPTSSFENDWQQQLLKRFASAGDASLEVGVHPGYGESWRSAERSAAVKFGADARAAGHRVIGWKEIR
ncbi:MAG TPA: ChbG/HpnK family deacetylase [Tepidisphaeraceae bacterium]|jgi:hypothetical protein|nr:ChbG/HpnK family deacetylase [Tepidisphaeraceae bacterium]